MNRTDPRLALGALAGLHELTGRGEYVAAGGERSVLLRLDGVTYQFLEDAIDGYRSSLGYVTTVAAPLAAGSFIGFAPIIVMVYEHAGVHPRGDHVIVGVSERTGLAIFVIGTEDIDDYYPSFVSSWTPEGDASCAYLRPA